MEHTQKQEKPILEFSKVSKKIGKATLIDDLSFDIGRGEIVGLLGPNGAGKTTTIRMMTGLFTPTEGDIRICGHNIRTNFNEAIVHLGAIIENPEFYPYMTGRENLKQFMRMMDTVTAERFQTVVQLVGLEDALDKKVKAYSLGMRQRLGIAQALLHKPALLILDEPTNGLDPAGIHEMRDYLRKITVEEGVSILISSHLLSEIEQLCSRVVVIQNGRLVTMQTIGAGRTLHQDGKESAAPITLSLRVTDPSLAQQVLGPLAYVKVQAIDTAQSTVAIEISERDVPAAVAALASAQVGIFRIAERAGSSLEDEFLKWTGGNRIA